MNLTKKLCTVAITFFIFLFAMSCCDSLLQNTVQAQDTVKKPLKVFVLVGQSNMQGHAQIRTLPHIGMDPATRPILDEIQNDAGEPRVLEDVWISLMSAGGVKTGHLTVGFGADENKIGPELTFGIYMQKRLGEPILIIKTAWGGKSITQISARQALEHTSLMSRPSNEWKSRKKTSWQSKLKKLLRPEFIIVTRSRT